MTDMTPEQEHAYYADPENHAPQGTPVRRTLGTPVPVRLPEDVRKRVQEQADADGRSVSNWIRRAIEHELSRAG